MVYLKKISAYLFFSAVTLLGLVGLYLLAAYTLPYISVDREKSTQEDVDIYILTNGVHTDLVLPLTNEGMDWSRKVLFGNTMSGDTNAQWVAFGWGDKGFYLNTPTWADLTFSTAFKAAFCLSTSAMHTTFYQEMKESKTCKKIRLSQNQYQRLVDYVNDSFITSNNGEFLNIKTTANYNRYDAFYEAKGRYSLFYTCNTWANNGLKISGQKACWWTPFDKGIFDLYQERIEN